MGVSVRRNVYPRRVLRCGSFRDLLENWEGKPRGWHKHCRRAFVRPLCYETPTLFAAAFVAGCLGATERVQSATGPERNRTPVATPSDDTDLYAGLERGDVQLSALCGRGHDDIVTEKLCSGKAITSLKDLELRLGLDFKSKERPMIAMLGHTTSITAREVSAINPRAIIFTKPASSARLEGAAKPNPNFVALAFARGKQFVEIVARDRTTHELRFFLVRFEQACNETTEGCSAFDLYSPAIEADWRQVSIYTDADLEGTTLDCLVCHQPKGPETQRSLRMHELQSPWTHFFRDDAPGKRLKSYYFSAHTGTETYAGIPWTEIAGKSQPTQLEGLVENEGFQSQPNEFPTLKIAIELAGQNVSPAASSTWKELERQALTSALFPIPFPLANASDVARLETAASSYRKAMSGEIEPKKMLSLADLHRDDARIMTGLSTPANADGHQVLARMCRRCHNSNLDQTLSRARFNVDQLDTMSDHEKQLAIERVRLPRSSRRAMPPVASGELTPEATEALIKALQ